MPLCVPPRGTAAPWGRSAASVPRSPPAPPAPRSPSPCRARGERGALSSPPRAARTTTLHDLAARCQSWMSDAVQAAASAAPEALFPGLARPELLAVRRTCRGWRDAVRRPLAAELVEAAAAAAGAAVAHEGRRLRIVGALRGLAAVSVAHVDPLTSRLLAGFLRDGEDEVREAAASAMGRATEGMQDLLGRMAVACLVPALADQSARVSAAAARALPRLVARGDQAASRAACAHLRQHADPCVRRNALSVLAEVGSRGDQDLVAAVCAAAQGDSDWRVRAQAARALPRLAERGDAAALAALEAALQDPSAAVRAVAAGAVVHVAEQPSAPFLAAVAAQWSPAHRSRKRAAHASAASPAPTPPPAARRRAAAETSTPPAPVAPSPRRSRAPGSAGSKGTSGPSGSGQGRGFTGASGKAAVARRAPQARRARHAAGAPAAAGIYRRER
ncbi:unnamed protein product [Prorocentrum cordatum]|uniref:HEAT repeat domain-containing protein n=1 Tax=Prorocentrum cordatum TaxID=2364126 RepID=A0ABN9XBJ9_9DINO|nr:unnamed protein product [Polarella glacialis]